MQTYTTRRNLAGSLINKSDSTTLTLLDNLMNACEKRILSARDWTFLWKQYTKLTVAGESTIKLPAYTRKPQGIYVTVGSYRYSPKEVTTRAEWDRLKVTTHQSDIMTHYIVYDGAIEVHPTPATSGNVVTFNARRVARDLNQADYTTGTITSVSTTGVTSTVTGSGVTWHTGMIGRFIRITDGNAANTLSGDHQWYEIATVPSSTTLTLVKTYQGTAIAAATAAYTIAQCSLIPEEHDMLPIYEALNLYFTSVDPNTQKAELYSKKFIEGYDFMVNDQGSKSNVVLDNGEEEEGMNPNLYVTL